MKVYVIYNRAGRPLAYVKASSHCIATKKAVSRYGAGVCVEYTAAE